MTENSKRPSFVGPHEGRELELMRTKNKPLAMFVEPEEPEFEYFPERQFDELVSKGELTKRVCIESIVLTFEDNRKIRRVLYSLPNETWRIDAMLFVNNIYNSLLPSFRPDLERVVGLLLGYNRNDIENFLDWMSDRRVAGK